jgi:hypothetical protein
MRKKFAIWCVKRLLEAVDKEAQARLYSYDEAAEYWRNIWHKRMWLIKVARFVDKSNTEQEIVNSGKWFY